MELKRAVESKKICKGGLKCPYCNGFNTGVFKKRLTRRAKRQVRQAVKKAMRKVGMNFMQKRTPIPSAMAIGGHGMKFQQEKLGLLFQKVGLAA